MQLTLPDAGDLSTPSCCMKFEIWARFFRRAPELSEGPGDYGGPQLRDGSKNLRRCGRCNPVAGTHLTVQSAPP